MTVGADSLPGWRGKQDADPHAGGDEIDDEAGDEAEGEAGDAPTPSPPQTDSHTYTATGGDSHNEPVVVWQADTNLEAEIVKGRLESEGIPAFLSGEALGTIYGFTTGNLAATDVLVPAPLAEKALEILHTEVEWEDAIWEDDADNASDADAGEPQ